jgi:DNA-binding ferritin-like protein
MDYCHWQMINSSFQKLDNKFKQQIAALTKKIDDISKQFADYRKTSTAQITELQTLNKSYQTKLDEAITVINQQIKTHESNIAELVDKFKIEQEAIKKQIEEHLKLNEVVTDTNENYADLAKQFANMVEFLRYVLGEVNDQLPELKIDLGQLALSQ